MANIRQLPDKEMRVFYKWLKTNLALLGHFDCTEVKYKVENFTPQKLDVNVNFFESKKKKKKNQVEDGEKFMMVVVDYKRKSVEN